MPMPDSTPKDVDGHRGEAAVFWSWITVLTLGLAYLIAVPLLGR